MDSFNYYNLRPHQEQAVSVTLNQLINDDKKKVLLALDSGTGKTAVLVELIQRLFRNKSISTVLILTPTRMTADSIQDTLNKTKICMVANQLTISSEKQISVLTYSKLRAQEVVGSTKKYDLVICDEAQYTKNINIEKLPIKPYTMFVGIISSSVDKKQNLGWFSRVPISFTYSYFESVEVGNHAILDPHKYGEIVEKFCQRLLEQNGYAVEFQPMISINNKRIELDMLISSGEQKTIIEIKAYRGRYTSQRVLDRAIEQLLKKREILENGQSIENTQNYSYCLILFCEVDQKTKMQVFREYGITIWDVANLLYICRNYSEFSKELSEILYYPITDIAPEEPYRWNPPPVDTVFEISNSQINNIESLVEKLRGCGTGNKEKASKIYERICTEIIGFLFEGEFTQISDQHKTNDDLFRMDLLCGIKGTSAFWELLIRHYNTRFVVFEYKNYSASLSQNLIYTTEKYLFNAVLRNVAVIISRKGFSRNAQNAALGCLKEHGKLIIDLTDEDLINMLQKKYDGEEPSDYMLWKLEKLLMSVSK